MEKWSLPEIERLKKLGSYISIDRLCYFLDRSRSSVLRKMKELAITPKIVYNSWSIADTEKLRLALETFPTWEIAKIRRKLFPERTRESIKGKIKQLRRNSEQNSKD